MAEPVQQIQAAVGYYVASACSGLACVPLWLASYKDAITAACAIIGVVLSIIFGCIGLYMSRKK